MLPTLRTMALSTVPGVGRQQYADPERRLPRAHPPGCRGMAADREHRLLYNRDLKGSQRVQAVREFVEAVCGWVVATSPLFGSTRL